MIVRRVDAGAHSVTQRDRWAGIRSLAVILCILAALAMVHEKSIFGFSSGKAAGDSSPIRTTVSGEVINTALLGKETPGYGGIVPLDIYVSGGRIDSIRALPNNETGERGQDEEIVSDSISPIQSASSQYPCFRISGNGCRPQGQVGSQEGVIQSFLTLSQV